MCRFLRSRASAARLPAQSVSQSAGAKSSPVLGWFVGLGVAVGTAVGTAVGAAVGVAVGSVVGVAVGSAVGVAVGSAVGVAVGSAVGVAVGSAVGVAVGSAVGVAVGSTVGVAVGSGVGVSSGAAIVKVFFMPSLAKDGEWRWLLCHCLRCHAKGNLWSLLRLLLYNFPALTCRESRDLHV